MQTLSILLCLCSSLQNFSNSWNVWKPKSGVKSSSAISHDGPCCARNSSAVDGADTPNSKTCMKSKTHNSTFIIFDDGSDLTAFDRSKLTIAQCWKGMRDVVSAACVAKNRFLYCSLSRGDTHMTSSPCPYLQVIYTIKFMQPLLLCLLFGDPPTADVICVFSPRPRPGPRRKILSPKPDFDSVMMEWIKYVVYWGPGGARALMWLTFRRYKWDHDRSITRQSQGWLRLTLYFLSSVLFANCAQRLAGLTCSQCGNTIKTGSMKRHMTWIKV